jgi:uncharacterized membrane protein
MPMTETRPALLRLSNAVASSLWIAPAAGAVIAIALAKAMTVVDLWLARSPAERWYLFGPSAESGRELLSAVANSILTFTGVVFSITILVLQLASSQYSPRVLRTFLRDRITRVALGVFVGSFVYALALLPEVRGGPAQEAQFVPRLAISVAFALALLSVGMFVAYLHRMAHSIRAVAIVVRVAAEARRTIEQVFPDDAGAEASPPETEDAGPSGQSRTINWRGPPGVISAVDGDRLLALAEKHDLRIELLRQVGDFVPKGAPVARVWGRGSEDLDSQISGRLFVAEERTAEQDPSFGFRQLVDIAERALSPGTNDPTTAVQALDQIHDLLRCLARRRFPPCRRTDRAGAVRLVQPRPGWADYVHLALDEIRQYGSGSLQVLRRLRTVIDDLLTVAPPDRRGPLEEQLALLAEATGQGMAAGGPRRMARQGSRQHA